MAIYYAFYSEQYFNRRGGVYYKTPDGREVLASQVSLDPNGSDFQWPDKVPLGVVTDYVRSVPGNFDRTFRDFENEIKKY